MSPLMHLFSNVTPFDLKYRDSIIIIDDMMKPTINSQKNVTERGLKNVLIRTNIITLLEEHQSITAKKISEILGYSTGLLYPQMRVLIADGVVTVGYTDTKWHKPVKTFSLTKNVK